MNKDRKGVDSWANRVLAVCKTGNHDAAISQIRACASLADVRQLQKKMTEGASISSDAALLQAVADQLRELSHPRLHRSP